MILSLSQVTYASYEMTSINIPEEARPHVDHKLVLAQSKEIKGKGYIERTSLKFEFLNGIENRINYESQGNIKSTQIKKDLSEIVTHYPLKTVPINVKISTLGYAPVGTFNEDTGWTGITEIFKSKDTGICQFSHFNLKESKGAYSLSKENERRDVNNKYTYVEVSGKENEGFDYKVVWFEDLNRYTLWDIVGNISGLLIADKGLIGEDYQAQLRTHTNVNLQTPLRSNMNDTRGKDFSRWLTSTRRLVETVIGQLSQQFHIEKIRARDLWHLTNRIGRKILAHTVGMLVNKLLGNPPLQFELLDIV